MAMRRIDRQLPSRALSTNPGGRASPSDRVDGRLPAMAPAQPAVR
jgi:hypothetical protein